jgi:hypothetical protein
VDEGFSLSRDKNLLVHFDVYVPKGSTRKLNVNIAFLKGTSVFNQANGELPEADASGRISYSTAFGSDNFPPGDYDLRITVTAGTERATSTGHFRIEP